MKRFFLLGLGVFLALPVRAANDSPAPLVPSLPAILPAQGKWSLEVLYSRVAAGALADEAHQTPFVVRALDAKGAPIAGVPVELPRIWNEEKELGDKNPDNSEIIMPRVTWNVPGKTLLTDAKGEARGVFTSGSMTGHLFLRGPGETKTDIEQIWNDNPEPLKDSGNWLAGHPRQIGITLSLLRGGKTLPISGHHLKLLLTSVTLEAYRFTGELDENGKPKFEMPSFKWIIEKPKENASPEEKVRWETVSQWVQSEYVRETSAGVYDTAVTAVNFNDIYPILDGVEIVGIESYGTYWQDQGVYNRLN